MDQPQNNAEAAELAPDAQTPVEAPAKPEVPQADDKFASKFAALSRKEKEIRHREAQFTAEMERIKAEKSEIEKWKAEKSNADSEFKNKISSNPLKVLEELGITFEDLTKMQLNEQNPTPEMLIARTRQELESGYKKELEELRNSLKQEKEKAASEQHEQVVSGFKKQINQFVDANEEAYELIKMNDAQELVFDVIQEYYESSGKVLSIEEAAKYTEQHLEEEAKRVMEAKKFKQTSPKQEPSEAKIAPTLSNTHAAEVPQSTAKPLSREESLKNAAKMIRWTE